MDDLNSTPDVDVSQLSAVELQRLGVTVAQVRTAYADPIAVIGPKAESAFPGVWQLLGFTDKGRFISVALDMTNEPENSQLSESKSPATSPNSATTSAAPSFHNPFQGPGAEEAWRHLRATRGNVVTREEMIRRVQEQANKGK